MGSSFIKVSCLHTSLGFFMHLILTLDYYLFNGSANDHKTDLPSLFTAIKVQSKGEHNFC